MNNKKIKEQIIEQLCDEKGIERTNISYDWITILKKDNIQRVMVNYNFDLNNAISQNLANDKYSTYSMLDFYKIPVVKHEILFNPKIMPEYNFGNNILENDNKVVIKANDSSQGKDVYISSNKEEKKKIVNKLFHEGKEAVCICPYLDIEYEYRAFFLDGEIIYIYKKEKPFVIGDGKLSVEELIKKQSNYCYEINSEIDLKYIPNQQEKIIIGWKHNLSNGAIPIVIDEQDLYYNEVKEIARKAGNALNLKFASVDLSLTSDKKLMVLEINASNIGISKFCEMVPNGVEIGKEIFSKVLDKIFKGEEK